MKIQLEGWFWREIEEGAAPFVLGLFMYAHNIYCWTILLCVKIKLFFLGILSFAIKKI